jgi:hypothetical protein
LKCLSRDGAGTIQSSEVLDGDGSRMIGSAMSYKVVRIPFQGYNSYVYRWAVERYHKHGLIEGMDNGDMECAPGKYARYCYEL